MAHPLFLAGLTVPILVFLAIFIVLFISINKDSLKTHQAYTVNNPEPILSITDQNK